MIEAHSVRVCVLASVSVPVTVTVNEEWKGRGAEQRVTRKRDRISLQETFLIIMIMIVKTIERENLIFLMCFQGMPHTRSHRHRRGKRDDPLPWTRKEREREEARQSERDMRSKEGEHTHAFSQKATHTHTDTHIHSHIDRRRSIGPHACTQTHAPTQKQHPSCLPHLSSSLFPDVDLRD